MALINPAHALRALKNSFAGIQRAWKQEQAFRHEVLCIPVMVALLFFLRPGVLWSALLLAGWCVVMGFELLNSAIEEVFDMISPEYNLHVKYGKDMASGAIFMALCCNALLWGAMLVKNFGW